MSFEPLRHKDTKENTKFESLSEREESIEKETSDALGTVNDGKIL
jgi:hypothetical protein